MTGYRIVVDRDLCQGHGVCASESPEVFAVTREHAVSVLDETPPAARRRSVEAAVKYCPTHALSLVEESD